MLLAPRQLLGQLLQAECHCKPCTCASQTQQWLASADQHTCLDSLFRADRLMTSPSTCHSGRMSTLRQAGVRSAARG